MRVWSFGGTERNNQSHPAFGKSYCIAWLVLAPKIEARFN